MTQELLPWVLLVVGNPTASIANAAQTRIDPPATILGRAFSLTSIAKTVCLLDDRLRLRWGEAIQQLWPSNLHALGLEERVLEGVVACLESMAREESAATVILIPYNHCAVEELTWLDSARGALSLGAANRNTVYLLHDNVDNDPRSTLNTPEVCTSSVLIGSVGALLALCRGARNTVMVDLVVGQPDEKCRAVFTDSADLQNTPLNLVHIRLVEEYANLQRQDVWHRRSRRISLHA